MFVHAKRCAVYFIRSFVKCLSWIILFILIESYRLFVLLRALLVKSTRRGGGRAGLTLLLAYAYYIRVPKVMIRNDHARLDSTGQSREGRRCDENWSRRDSRSTMILTLIIIILQTRSIDVIATVTSFIAENFSIFVRSYLFFFFFIPSYCPFAPFVYVSWFVYLFFFIFFYIFIFSFCLFVCYLSIFLRFGFVRKKERTLLPQHSFLLLVTMVASREGRMFFFYHFFLPSLSFLSFLLFSIVEILFPSFYMGWPRITARHVAKGLDDY